MTVMSSRMALVRVKARTRQVAARDVVGCIPIRAVTTSAPAPTLLGTKGVTLSRRFSPMGLVTVKVLTRRLVAEQDVVGLRFTS